MSRFSTEPSHEAQIRTASFALAALGILTVALGFYLTGPRIVEFATEYLSADRALSDGTKAWLYTIPMKIIAAGLLVAVASIVMKYTGPLAVSGFLRAEALLVPRITDYFEGSMSFIGKGSARLFRFAATETAMWCFVVLILLTLSVPSYFLVTGGRLSCRRSRSATCEESCQTWDLWNLNDPGLRRTHSPKFGRTGDHSAECLVVQNVWNKCVCEPSTTCCVCYWKHIVILFHRAKTFRTKGCHTWYVHLYAYRADDVPRSDGNGT